MFMGLDRSRASVVTGLIGLTQ